MIQEAFDACFKIGESYPFDTLAIQLDGCNEVRLLERHVLKNCKPGFGYLSRACDAIEAFME